MYWHDLYIHIALVLLLHVLSMYMFHVQWCV